MKLIHYSGVSVLEKHAADLAEFKAQFEVVSGPLSLSIEDVLKSDFAVIELGPQDFEKFKPFLPSLDLKTSRLGTADTLIRQGKQLHTYRLTADAVYEALLQKVPDLKTSESAVVIGDYDFVLSMVYKLAQAGFFKLIIATDSMNDSIKIRNLVQQYAFNIQISTVALSELTQLESGSVLLISNLIKKDHPEAYESLTYFNFLSRGAAFVDLNSKNEPVLADEARRAEIIIVEEIDILKIKYRSMLELFKISPLV